MADYLKIPDLARRLDVSEKTARKYVKEGVLPSVFIGGAYRVSEEDLEGYLQGAKVEPGKAPGPAPQLELEEQRGADEEQASLSIQEASKLPLMVFELPGLKTARESRGISVNELSFRTGLQAAAISDLESGNRVPDQNTVSLLARAIDDCPRAELIFPPESYNPDTFRDDGTTVMYADQLVTPGGRKVSQAINESWRRRNQEQSDAG